MSAGPVRIIGRINGTHPSENETDLLGQHGRSLQETWHYLAPFGRFIEIRKRNSNVFKNLPIEPFERNISFCSVDLAMAMKHNPKLMSQIMTDHQAWKMPSTHYRQDDTWEKLVVDWAQVLPQIKPKDWSRNFRPKGSTSMRRHAIPAMLMLWGLLFASLRTHYY